jgi:hypothetical protein
MIHTHMQRGMKNRPRVSNRLAALAATVLLLSSVAGRSLVPDSDPANLQATVPETGSSTLAEESITEMVGVNPPSRPARNFKISSLIFRF